jgi:hypothetical protein
MRSNDLLKKEEFLKTNMLEGGKGAAQNYSNYYQ